MLPLKLQAPLKDYLWGGRRLAEEFGKLTADPAQKVAESWELSCHKDGSSVIAGGAYDGLTLPEYLERAGNGVLGTDCARFADFPILIKLIDAKQSLSVQVHPQNEYALRVEGEYGKTEMWYIVDCEPGAELIYGFRHPISREEFRRRIETDTLLEVTNNVPVHPGDVFFIEAGTLHAIGAGILIAEIQQNSNSTYRVYDFGRLGADGKPRPLHIDKALDVTELTTPARTGQPQGAPVEHESYTETLLSSCDYFTVRALEIRTCFDGTAGTASFHSLLCLDGRLELSSAQEEGPVSMPLQKGESIFLPAGFGGYRLEGAGKVLLTTV